MAVMAKKEGVPAWAATSSAIILQILALSTGALVVAGTGSGILDGAGDPRLGGLTFLIVGVGSLFLVLLALWPPFLTRVTQLLTQQPMNETPSHRAIILALGANVGAWFAYGVGFWLFAHGTLPSITLSLPQAIAASTAAYVVGVLTPFAPGGLGVREGILVIALRGQTGLGEALALAAVARIGMTVADLFDNLAEQIDPRPFTIAHVGGRYADISVHDPAIELRARSKEEPALDRAAGDLDERANLCRGER